MAIGICPKVECTEHYIHGHGGDGDEHFLPRLASDRDRPMGDGGAEKMEVCPHEACTESVEHMHVDETQPSGYTPYFLPKPRPVCPHEDCGYIISHGHGTEGMFSPRNGGQCQIGGCRFPFPHLHGRTNDRDGTMAPPQEPGDKVLAYNARATATVPVKETYVRTGGNAHGWQDQFGLVWKWDALVEPEPWRDVRYDMPDFAEDPNSARSPGWGNRYCPHCDHETFGGYESVTEEAMWEHFEKCEVLHPPVPEPAKIPTPGGFDAVLYAAYVAGVKCEFEYYEVDGYVEGFREWRAQWHGEWVTE